MSSFCTLDTNFLLMFVSITTDMEYTDRGVTSEPLCEIKFLKLVEIFVVASLEWENVISFS